MPILNAGSMRIAADKQARGAGAASRLAQALACSLCAALAGAAFSAQEPAPTEPPPAEPRPGPAPGATTPERAAGTGAQPAASDPAGGAEAGTENEAAAEAPAPFEPTYRGLDGIAAELDRWRRLRPDHARALDLGVTGDGRPVPAIEFGAPGPVALEERPTAFLLGGLDGCSLSGGEAVLACVDALLREPEGLSQDFCFVALPWASPEALEMNHSGRASDGRNARALDEDHDGRIDEDGPDDLDGDGAVLQMLIEDPRGPWARCDDGRFLVQAGPGDAPRYLLTSEGRDDDGDGSFNEDGPGGVVLDINFPVERVGPWTGELNGPLPMSEPLVRTLADTVLARRTALVLLFQGNHGGLAAPGGLARLDGRGLIHPLDLPVFQRATALFAASTGRDQRRVLSLCESHGADRRGAALDWLYAVPGALCFEVAAWGPTIEGAPEVTARDARYQPSTAGALPDVGLLDRVWSLWLDNTRGGLGFVDWHPVDLAGGRQALVGGWEPHTRLNPPAEMLPRSLEGLPEFVRELAASRPRLDIAAQFERRGEVCRISARVRNSGLLPTSLAISEARGAPGGALTLELGLPPGASLLAGKPIHALPRLLGSDQSEHLEWIVLAPPGSAFTLTARSPWTLPVAREVKP